MPSSEDLLVGYAGLVRRVCGAGSITLFIPPSPDGRAREVLVHEGPLPPAPELDDRADAADRVLEIEAHGPPGGDSQPGPTPWLVPSADPDCRLLRVPMGSNGDTRTEVVAEDKRGKGAGLAFATPLWIGLRFEPGRCPFRETGGAVRFDVRLDDTANEGLWDRILNVAGNLGAHSRMLDSVLNDPVSRLSGRVEFQARLLHAIGDTRRSGVPFSILMVNPDDFESVNRRLGREAGDAVIREVAERLCGSLRHSDRVSRYGGAIFSCLLPGTTAAQTGKVAAKVLRSLSEGAYHEGAVRLGFSVGAAACDRSDHAVDDPLELIRQADQALSAAKGEGGNQARVWSSAEDLQRAGHLDRLAGIFTGNVTRDYRNMSLLWDSVRAVTAAGDVEELAASVVERLQSGLGLEHAGIYRKSGNGNWAVLVGRGQRLGNGRASELPVLTQDRIELMDRACSEADGSPEVLEGDDGRSAVAVALRARDEVIGCLYLEGETERLTFDSSDLLFLETFAAQMAIALDRAQLAERERERQDQEQRRLRAEVDALRRAAGDVNLSYRSPRMDEVLATVRRVAPTDATILITGESGTGKELLARTIHELSARSDEPLHIVDCGAISPTLIESELFGHERGAFTGAHARKTGRLVEAEGATVFLDEIGELPLEVQSKLLRFVQERQVTPVGSTRPQTVDVRIIAATNVDLSTRVTDGTFREDLYHRLNVVRVTVPPLRERPEDIMLLAAQFIESFAALYRKDVAGLSPPARDLLMAHRWPGNVRELKNRIMQAVLLCDGSELTPRDFPGVGATAPAADPQPEHRPIVTAPPIPTSLAAATHPAPAPDAAPEPSESTAEDVLDRLRSALGRQIEAAVGGERRTLFPLGKWLGDDLIMAADAAHGSVARRAATALGIPETTYRRRMRKAAQRETAGLAVRPNTWAEVRALLAELVRCELDNDENLLDRTERILLEEVTSRFPDDIKTGSALLGVTEPTLLRRLA